MCSRSQYPDVRNREEFSRPGVYVLTGPSEASASRQAIYIGQADIARERLDTHAKSNDFWTQLILFTSKDLNLNRAHVQYLESQLIDLARSAKRADIQNANTPRLPSLSPADEADMDAFLEDMLLIYPLLGVTAFETVGEETRQQGVRLVLRGKDTLAQGQDTREGFIVFQGSIGRPNIVPSMHAYMQELRQKLIETGVLELRPNGLVMTQDFRFDSPSTAAGVLLGRSSNGRVEWKDESGRTLKEIQESSLSASSLGMGSATGVLTVESD
jgi:hypothetical protein